ncbi:uncharacterized protein LOC131852097 [Achroia grisella]|uniref:uncharacterized protein LOC131852097 n=1 Tax=Achroia grisella TaxID=688607 RepID=UPI0027D33B62|nr:uncharacterized protein LOC131852097 [Achroia grisella]
MPGKIKVKVLAGRNLPVMDRASDTTDAFVEIKFGSVTHKTDVCRKSLNPHWNSTEWYRFEVDESELQDEPLQLRLMDHDTYSANDAIGKVVISLAPLLAREANNAKGNAPHGAVMSGWIPVFDTMHGIRGELNVIVKVELFSDFNKYKTSSCGVQFFHCPMIPPGYKATSIHGFVEELVVNDDPEYQWIDKIRTPRASNEARQVAFIKLSNQVQRLVGLKAAELGANAVVGYQQDFDLEGEAGVVARAIGTAVSITPLPTPSQPMNIPPCTQQQLKKYLDILSTDNENTTDLNEYYQHHQDELAKLLTILNPKTPTLLDETDVIEDNDDEKSYALTRQSSIKSYTGSVSIYQDDYISQKSLKHISEDQTDLNRLLNRNSLDSDSPGPLRKIKKFKTNFFLKRLSSMRGRKDTQDDQISLKSNSSDASRISLDIKNEFKKFKRMKKPKFSKTYTNNADEGIGMASVLARSVIHAHTSLACIAETQDSEHSPNSTLRRASESEPTINVSDEDKPKTTTDTDTSIDANSNKDENKKVPEIHFSSLKNINSDEPEILEKRGRRLSESCPTSPMASRNDNLLKLPEDADYYGSVSSALSGESSEIYSSSDEDDESSDVRTDTEKSIETTSSLVHSVLSHEINPALIAQMDRKLSTLKTEKLDRQLLEEDIQNKTTDAYKFDNTRNENNDMEKQEVAAISAGEHPEMFVVKKSNSHHFKFHNPFTHKKVSKSLSAPTSPVENSSFVYRSSQKIKRQLSKLSTSNMIKSLSHYSLIHKKKQEEVKSLSKPSSTADILSKVPSETVLGSPFLSYADLLSLDKEGIDLNKRFHKSDEYVGPKVSMYIGSEPASRASLSGTLYTEHGSHDLNYHEHNSNKKDKCSIKPSGLLHTAMETILIDKVQSLLSPSSPEPIPAANQFFNDVSEKLEKVEVDRNKTPETTGLVHTAMETILLDKVQSLLIPTTPEPSPPKQFFDKIDPILVQSNKSEQETSGLTHTAMKTILMDKVQTLVNPNTEFEPVEVKSLLLDSEKTCSKNHEMQESTEIEIEPSNEESGSLKSAENDANIDKVEAHSPISSSLISSETKDVSTNINTDYKELKEKKKLVRQDRVESNNENESHKMSKKSNTVPHKLTTPVLQHFHPILSGGAPLETIPSLPESSFDQSESLDEISSGTNNASVCDNSHAAWPVDRSERDKDKGEKDKGSPRHARHESYGGKEPVPAVTHTQNSSLNSTSTPMGIHRRSSDSDLSITPKGSSLNASGVNVGSGGGAILRPSMNSNNLEMLEYPFLTMTEYPPGFIVHIGGTVCARSVKLADGGESAARAAWWAELRTELRAHARALRCNAVLAYSDAAAICEDVCVLSASGTAAVINLDCDFNAESEPIPANTKAADEVDECCSIAHVPYSPGAGPYRAELSVCGGCRRARVPAVVLASCAKPARLPACPKAVTITAVAARVRRAPPTGEPAARDISDQLPFLEYELHKLLIAKLRMQGANAVFSLQTQVCVGERCVMALASGSAVRLAALPPPTPPRIKASENDKDALEIQKALWDTFTANKAANGFDVGGPEFSTNGALPEVEGDESTAPALDLCADKDACVLELDEAEDVETARTLAARRLHARLPLYTAQRARAPPHAYTQVWRARLQLAGQGGASTAAERHVARALDGVAYKLRRLQPCALLAPRLQLDLPEDEIQLVLSGAAIPLVDPTKPDINGLSENRNLQTSNQIQTSHGNGTGDADDDIFALDEEQLVRTQPSEVVEEKAPINGQASAAPASVSLWSASSARGSRLCALRLLFVRETTCVRELGGLSGFLHTFTCEVLAIARAYTAALGGNALTSFYITQLMLQDNAHKNQGQCLLSVGGDVVHITY